MSFIGSQGIVDTRRTTWWVNAPTQMLIMGHQSSGLVWVFIYLPFKSFHKLTVFSSLGRGGALLDRVWFQSLSGRPPLPNLCSHMVQDREQGPIGMVWGEILGKWVTFILGLNW